MSFDGFAAQADAEFDGPVDDRGQPKIGNEDLDVEVKFSREGPTEYRWYWESPKRHPYVGPWRLSRQQAFQEGQDWLAVGRL